MSLTPLPPSPRKVCLWRIFFALPFRNGPLPAELKFRENTGSGREEVVSYPALFLGVETKADVYETTVRKLEVIIMFFNDLNEWQPEPAMDQPRCLMICRSFYVCFVSRIQYVCQTINIFKCYSYNGKGSTMYWEKAVSEYFLPISSTSPSFKYFNTSKF